MTPRCRLALPSDATALAALRYEFRAGLGAPTESAETFIARCTPWMAERLANPSPWLCWVLETEGAIAGNLWLQLIEKVPNPVDEREYHAYITSVYVRPEARGAGGGEQLVTVALAWCREQGVDSVILWPTARSRTLYARHGFAVRDDLLEAILDPGRAPGGESTPHQETS